MAYRRTERVEEQLQDKRDRILQAVRQVVAEVGFRGAQVAIVAEAARVLAPGGRLLLSVPYWNGARRLLTRRLVREGDQIRAAGGQFYQFAFTRGEVRTFVEAHGFRVIAFHPYDPARMWRKRFKRLAAGLGGEDGAVSAASDRSLRPTSVSARRLARTAIRKILYGEVALRLFGHMILAVAVKT